MRNKLLLILFVLLANPVSAAMEKDLPTIQEHGRAKEAMLDSLDALGKRVAELEKISNALQLSGLHEESLKLMLGIRERKSLIERGEYVNSEDLAVRASALESDIYKAIESEAIQHLNTNTGLEYQEINSVLEEAAEKKELPALAHALLTYRIELQNTPREQQRRLVEFQKSSSDYRRVKGTFALVVLISALISYVVFQKLSQGKRNREVIEAFTTQAASNPSSVSMRLMEDPTVQTMLNRRISDEERRILGD